MMSPVTLEQIRQRHTRASPRRIIDTPVTKWPDTWGSAETCFVEHTWYDVEELLREVKRLQEIEFRTKELEK